MAGSEVSDHLRLLVRGFVSRDPAVRHVCFLEHLVQRSDYTLAHCEDDERAGCISGDLNEPLLHDVHEFFVLGKQPVELPGPPTLNDGGHDPPGTFVEVELVERLGEVHRILDVFDRSHVSFRNIHRLLEAGEVIGSGSEVDEPVNVRGCRERVEPRLAVDTQEVEVPTNTRCRIEDVLHAVTPLGVVVVRGCRTQDDRSSEVCCRSIQLFEADCGVASEHVELVSDDRLIASEFEVTHSELGVADHLHLHTEAGCLGVPLCMGGRRGDHERGLVAAPAEARQGRERLATARPVVQQQALGRALEGDLRQSLLLVGLPLHAGLNGVHAVGVRVPDEPPLVRNQT